MSRRFKAILVGAFTAATIGLSSAQAFDTPYVLLDGGNGVALNPVIRSTPPAASQALPEPLMVAFIRYTRAQAISNGAALEAERTWQELRLELEKLGLFE